MSAAINAEFRHTVAEYSILKGNPEPKNEGNGVIDVEDVEDEGDGMHSVLVVGCNISRFEQAQSLFGSWDVDLSSCSIPPAAVRSQCLWIKIGISENARNRCVLIRALKYR